jgi:Domain of unknown function (DUF3303)
MRVAVIYRPQSAAPPETAAMLFGALGQWVESWTPRVDALEFFVDGGGFVVGDFTDAAVMQQMVATNPFTPYMDVQILPVIDPGTAMATYHEVLEALAGAAATA